MIFISRLFAIVLFYALVIIFNPIDLIALDQSIIEINRNPESKSIPYDGNIKFFSQYSISSQCSQIEDFSQVLSKYQLEEFQQVELALRDLIKKYPMCADSRAALTALLWHKGLIGEASSNWAAAFGLDNRYTYKDWLLNIRHWPSKPAEDLVAFLDWIK